MKNKRNYLVFVLIMLSILLSGCWSYTEIEERLVVGSVGIDYGKYKDTYRVTIRAVTSKPSATGIEVVPEVISMEGKSIFNIIRNAAPIYGNKLYWSHLQSIVVSEELAQEDIITLLDFFYRDAELRQDNKVYIASGASSEEIVRKEAYLQKANQFSLRKAVKTQDFLGTFPEIDFIEFKKNVLDETTQAILPIVSIYKDEPEIIRIHGTAIFHGTKLVGKFNSNESLILSLIRNNVKNPLVIIPLDRRRSPSEESNITLEVFQAKSKVKSDIKDGKINILIDIELDTGVAEANYAANYLDENSIKELEGVSEDEIRKAVTATIRKAQEQYKADIFGFGKAVEIKDPKLWKKIRGGWSEEFANIPVDVNVTVNIMSTGKPTTS